MKLFILATLLIATLLSPSAGPVDAVATLPITWSAPAALNTNATTDTGLDGFIFGPPQVTTDGTGSWVAVWMSQENLGGTIGTDNDILVARSTDNGATWTAPAALNTNATTDAGADNFPQVTTDSAGNWVAVWKSFENLGGTIGTDADILVARSTNNGATWTAPAALNTNATTDTGSDHFPQVTTDGAGNWVAVWDSGENLGGTIGSDLDILVATSAAAVGGIVELPEVAAAPLEAAGSSSPDVGVLAGVGGGIAAAVVALGGAAWYTRRQRMR
ncbi:MAG: exo-alpha-sialidase [Chloroflexi bacterium]|nr:exo-alpha-sialidase [Chloroflexota bacterium]